MNDGECYFYNDGSTIYAFPNVNCNEGASFPNVQGQRRDTYRLINGRYIHTRSDTVNFNQDYSQFVAHKWDGNSLHLDVNYLVMPATMICLCFFFVIYKWFIRLRG